jgi:hypothetical protein
MSDLELTLMLIESKCRRYKCKWYHGGKWPQAYKREKKNFCNKYPCGIPNHITFGYPKHPPQCEYYSSKKNQRASHYDRWNALFFILKGQA